MVHKKRFIVFTRYPVPGFVKSRLIPALGAQGAATLLADMTRHAIHTARKALAGGESSLEVHFEGGNTAGMQELYGDDIVYVPQAGNDLGERMHASFISVLNSGADAAVLMGTDCPGITEAIIRKAFAALEEADCVVGPAKDGGYYLIGMKRDIPEVFASMQWGTDAVLRQTQEALEYLGLKAVLLDELHDVDRPTDLAVWDQVKQGLAVPVISVIIPALDEGGYIGETIRSALAGRNVEVIVVDGGSTDGTVRIAQRTGVRIIPAGKGRALQMNEGASAASGEILLFLHADTLLPARYDDMIRAALADGRTVAGAFSLAFEGGGISMGIMAMGANLRSRILGLPYGDQAIFVKRDIFTRTGGFREVPIMEDVIFVKTVKKQGAVARLSEPVITSGRRYHAIGPLRAWALNQLAMIGYASGIPLDDLAGLYRSREKSLRLWLKHIVTARNEGRSA